jgi:hypothetical protein
MTHLRLGCQIFLGTTYQNGEKYTKGSQNLPKWPLNIPFRRNIDQNGPKNTNIFRCKTFQNLPKLVFLV